MGDKIFLDKESKKNRIHAFVQVGSYTIKKGKFDTHFSIVHNIDSEILRKIIQKAIDEYFSGKQNII